MEETQNFPATEKVSKLMMKYALPCMISLLAGALYNIVDQLFIANASYLGSYGNAANTVVFPLTVIALAIVVCIGDGCCAMVSGLLGEGKGEQAGFIFLRQEAKRLKQAGSAVLNKSFNISSSFTVLCLLMANLVRRFD